MSRCLSVSVLMFSCFMLLNIDADSSPITFIRWICFLEMFISLSLNVTLYGSHVKTVPLELQQLQLILSTVFMPFVGFFCIFFVFSMYQYFVTFFQEQPTQGMFCFSLDLSLKPFFSSVRGIFPHLFWVCLYKWYKTKAIHSIISITLVLLESIYQCSDPRFLVTSHCDNIIIQ